MSNGQSNSAYVFLVRHASRDVLWNQPEADHSMKNWADVIPVAESQFDTPGGPLTYGLAGRLCDQLETDDIVIAKVLHSNHKVAKQTARIFETVLEKRSRFEGEIAPSEALTPGSARKKQTGTIITEVKKWHSNGRTDRTRGLVIVGHQPQLNNIAKGLLKKKPPGGVVPLGSSEIACVRLGSKPRLLWLITAKPASLLEDLREKIRSKYDVAKFFLGALVVGTGLSLSKDIWETAQLVDKVLAGLGAIAALVSLALTAATLFSYDRLLMPISFWSGSSDAGRDSDPKRWTVQRPPSQAHVILFYEMVHVWKNFFTPALVFAFTALALNIIVLAHIGVGELPKVKSWALPLVFLLFAIIAFLVPALLYARGKPKLGFDD